MALDLKKKSSTTTAAAGNGAPVTEESSDRAVHKVKAPGFIRAAAEVKRRLILNVQGGEGTGKNHFSFSYTGGGPIYVHSFDQGLEGVVQKFQDTREIYTAEYELTIQPGEGTAQEVAKGAGKVYDEFVANYRDSLASTRKEGLVICDTGTEAWELLRLASFGKLTQVMPHHYAKPNAEFRDLVREGYDASNVIWIHKTKDEWINDDKGKGNKTGNKKLAGMNDIPFLVQGTVETGMRPLEGGGALFYITVQDKYRMNPDLIGSELDNDFDTLLALTYA